jgi:sec-independent protein translocase protein TatC
MANAAGEMPFLDHLEELRKRIMLSLLGMTIGIGVGWIVTRHFKLIQVISAPIAPYVPGGKLMVTTMIAPFMLNFKLAVVLGLVLASPWVLYQVWIFLAPALTPREKRAIIPTLAAGLALFLAGAVAGWVYVVPPMVKWFIQFDAGSFNTQITYDSYVQLVLHLLLAMGVSCEIPLVMILLSLLGVVSYRVYGRFRRYAVVLSFVGGAVISPTPEVSMMILFTIPLLLLYEVGVLGAYVIDRRRLRAARNAAAAIILALVLVPARAHAQLPPAPPGQVRPGSSDSLRRGLTGQGLQRMDSAQLKRLGMPAGPERVFPAPDSVMQALLGRAGFAATRYLADSASFGVGDQRILLGGHAATLREGNNLEADRIVYDNASCILAAEGFPRMFQEGQAPVIGVTMQFNTCLERGLVGEAFTSVAQQGSNWFIRGNLAVDSSGKRLYAAKGEFTSCDLPEPHYHFEAGQVKWTQQSVIVARPAVLYIRDVPVAWMPFIFQDTKSGNRSSGILIPRFGFNDIVRPTRGYNRSVSNLGYFWAPNDYVDVAAHFDWYANRYIQFGGDLHYAWLNRFVEGGIRLNQQIQDDGATNKTISWQHNQKFNVNTSLAFNFNYASDTRVLQNNALNPLLSTQLITSQARLNKRYRWGDVTLGGTRSQSLSDGSVEMTLPSFTVSPKPMSIGSFLTWSPNLSVTNALRQNTPGTPFDVLSPDGLAQDSARTRSRNTNISLSTPIQLGHFNWSNSLAYADQNFVGRRVVTQRVPDLTTSDPDDSVTVTDVRAGDFQSTFDWTTSINLPLLLPGTWKVTPSVGVTNATSGAMLVRSPGSNGGWVAQGKKFQLGLSAAPTFFGFLYHGVGPYSAFRYTFAPLLSMHWSPAASVPLAYAKAVGTSTNAAQLVIPPSMFASITLHQTFEAKLRTKDTTSDPAALARIPKKQLLSISTSAVSYDFEQAKLAGRTGWTTSAVTNNFQSDLLQGFQLSTTHDLWQGTVGSDTARFSPFLANVNANFSLTGRTFRSIGALLGLVHRDTVVASTPPLGSTSPLTAANSLSMMRQGPALQALSRSPFAMSVNYSLSRQRAVGTTALPVSTEDNPNDPFGSTPPFLPLPAPEPNSSVGLTMRFSPTQFWTLSWNTQYDITRHQFQSQVIQLQRDLHDWRATFNFVKNPNGNFALTFSVFLMTLPDIKFDYQQTTLQQTTFQQTPLQP